MPLLYLHMGDDEYLIIHSCEIAIHVHQIHILLLKGIPQYTSHWAEHLSESICNNQHQLGFATIEAWYSILM